MHSILGHHEIVADLENRLRGLAMAYSAVVEQTNAEHVGLFVVADGWATRLAQPGGHRAAMQILTHLVSELERRGTDFWATPLGRACGWWTGAGQLDNSAGDLDIATPTARVHALLGVSRQAAHELVTKGKLRKVTPNGVDAADVRREMQARWPL